MSMSLSVSVSMDRDMDRDMDVDVDMGRSRCFLTFFPFDIFSTSRPVFSHEQFAVIILHVDFLPETFCRGDVLLGDVLLQGDVLLRRRFVKETFC